MSVRGLSFCASLRWFTGKMPCPAQSKCMWTFHKNHFVWKFKGKMPDANPAAPVSCEPAQSKCTWTFHEPFVRFFSRKYANTACAVEMHMDISQEPFCVNLQKNAGRYGYHVDQTARLNTYRKNPLVWPHCLGNNIKNKTHLFHGI